MRTLAYVYTRVQRERENKSKQIAKHCYFVLCFEIFFSPVDAVAPGWGPMEVGEVFQTALIVQMIMFTGIPRGTKHRIQADYWDLRMSREQGCGCLQRPYGSLYGNPFGCWQPGTSHSDSGMVGYSRPVSIPHWFIDYIKTPAAEQ
jgi:hypothetical protein